MWKVASITWRSIYHGKRLFVADLGNDSVGIVDLESRKVIRTIGGLKEPQGVGYVPSTDTLFVTNAGDGSVMAVPRLGLRGSGTT